MIKAIIIDDEKKARENLINYLSKYCNDIMVISEADGVNSGLTQITKMKPDIIFLDIRMQDGTGFDLLDRVNKIDFEVIFVTAFDQYAIKAFKFSALDYILKPIDPEELIKAVSKFKKENDFSDIRSKLNTLFENNRELKRIALPSLDGYKFIDISQITRIESDGSYSTVYTANSNKMLVTKLLKDFENMLVSHGFSRVHKSHLINHNFIKDYIKGEGGTIIMEDGTEIDVARRRKPSLLSALLKWG